MTEHREQHGSRPAESPEFTGPPGPPESPGAPDQTSEGPEGTPGNTGDDVAELPEFSRRLGAPIATVRPVGRPPSQVSGLPSSGGAVARATGRPLGAQTHNSEDGSKDTGEGASAESSQQPHNPADLGYLPAPGQQPPSPQQSGTPMVRGGGLPVSGPEGSSQPAPSGGEQQTFYEAVGGHETFKKIVDVFYAQVAEDDDFRALYPEEDLEPAKERLLMFLEQYWGGPRTYQEQRGHPRLRMRHMPFKVDAWARDTWLRYMRHAVDAAELSPLHHEILWDYLERAAHSMVNS